jgi:hypothetical protein
MRTLWPIGSVSDETLLWRAAQGSGAGQNVRDKNHSFAAHARVDRSVTGCYNLAVEPGSPVYSPPRRPGLLLALIHPTAWKANSPKFASVLGRWHHARVGGRAGSGCGGGPRRWDKH